jgi:extracellular elastinolytic metalloproteinase
VYDGLGVRFDRTEPIDCKVGQTAKVCNGGTTGHRGGYTYADYGQVFGGPEVHADGEIWSQTLWDLRRKLGSRTSDSLVTRAMELAPYNPSFLDMRNAILVADTAVFHGSNHTAIWRVFAHRGMGFFAGSLGGNDTQPSADFEMPPDSADLSTIQGTVTDGDSDKKLEGITVTLAFQASGPTNPTAVTDDQGDFTISNVPHGHYPRLVATGHGYHEAQEVTVSGGTPPVDFAPRFNWAGADNGAQVVAANGKDYTGFGCGPDRAIDGSQSTGWSTSAGPGNQTTGTNGFAAKHITIRLDEPVDVADLAVDPSFTCGDDPTSSTADYQIEGSMDGNTYAPLAGGTFTDDDTGRLNIVHPNGSTSGIQFLRFTIASDQVPDFDGLCGAGGGPSGCHFTDVSEIQVFGTPAS